MDARLSSWLRASEGDDAMVEVKAQYESAVVGPNGCSAQCDESLGCGDERRMVLLRSGG